MNALILVIVLTWKLFSSRYVEPSIRPDDSRYGDNPNRLQRHTQFQVFFLFLFLFNML